MHPCAPPLPALPSHRRRRARALAPVASLAAVLLLLGCTEVRALIVDVHPVDYEPDGGAAPEADAAIAGIFGGADKERAQLPVRLKRVTTGLNQPTDIQFPPGRSDAALVLEKPGRIVEFKVGSTGWTRTGELLSLDVATESERGLLGLAFHPKYPEIPKFYLNYSTNTVTGDISRVSEWTVTGTLGQGAKATGERVVMEIAQPYANHNGGQLAFGPDGMLYIGWGDGGWRDDPDGNGQNAATWLGSMLRIDVTPGPDGAAYTVPADNPFIGCPGRTGCPDGPPGHYAAGVAPETYATGLRNPWRYSFANDGMLIVADVGQNLWEEIDLVPAGANLGWDTREGRHCFEPAKGCTTAGLTEPVYEYGRDEGMSITGGYVYNGAVIPALKGSYVFADFVTGKLWALDLPAAPGGPLLAATALGDWEILPSTFGRDGNGELFVSDFGTGSVLQLVPSR
jgi:glucose/arabinose dehydrogenase